MKRDILKILVGIWRLVPTLLYCLVGAFAAITGWYRLEAWCVDQLEAMEN